MWKTHVFSRIRSVKSSDFFRVHANQVAKLERMRALWILGFLIYTRGGPTKFTRIIIFRKNANRKNPRKKTRTRMLGVPGKKNRRIIRSQYGSGRTADPTPPIPLHESIVAQGSQAEGMYPDVITYSEDAEAAGLENGDHTEPRRHQSEELEEHPSENADTETAMIASTMSFFIFVLSPYRQWGKSLNQSGSSRRSI